MIPVITGVLSSLATSIVFLLCLSLLRPKIEISNKIAFGSGRDGDMHSIKIINRTPYSIVGIRAELELITQQPVPNGYITEAKDIPLKTNSLMMVDKFSESDKEANYAVRFNICEDLRKIWIESPNSCLRFNIYAIHSVSNFGKVHSRTYYTLDEALIDGVFEFGNSMKVIPSKTVGN